MANNNSNRDRSPEKPAPSIRFGQDAKAISESIIGFINRNEKLTERTLVPELVPALGSDFMRRVRRSSAFSKAWNNYLKTNATLSTAPMYEMGPAEAVPGIMTLWFTPVLADSNDDQVSMTHISYLAKWMNEMVASNNTKNWQPGDQQFVDVAVGCLKMYLSVATRALMLMRDATTNVSPTNTYLNAIAFLKAMGFEFTADEISDKFTSMWRYFNNNILNTVNANSWLKYSYPGMNRWASLCEGIYRDTPAKTSYAQYYIFMPNYMMELSDQFDVDNQRIGWNIGFKRSQQDGRPLTLRELYSYSSVPIGQRGYQQFIAFLKDIENMIKFIFYNDDTRTIIATLKQIDIRGFETDLSASTEFNFETLKFMSDVTNPEEAVPVIYDSNMLLAIHNSTIMTNLFTTDAYVVPQSGNLAQELYLALGAGERASEHGYGPAALNAHGGLALAFTPKVMNFPSFAPTVSDYVNATQWTFSLAGTLPPAENSSDPEPDEVVATRQQKGLDRAKLYDSKALSTLQASIPAYGSRIESISVGTDFISDCTITQMAVLGNLSDLRLASDLTTCETYAVIPYSGTFLSADVTASEVTAYDDYWATTAGHDGPPLLNAIFMNQTQYQAAQQFAFSPIAHNVQLIAPTSDYQYWHYRYCGPVTQSDVYYVVDGRYLAGMHSQWRANFWGYPVHVQDGEGTPQLSNYDTAVGIGNDPFTP